MSKFQQGFRFVIVNHTCPAFQRGFYASTLETAQSFTKYWGGTITKGILS